MYFSFLLHSDGLIRHEFNPAYLNGIPERVVSDPHYTFQMLTSATDFKSFVSYVSKMM